LEFEIKRLNDVLITRVKENDELRARNGRLEIQVRDYQIFE